MHCCCFIDEDISQTRALKPETVLFEALCYSKGIVSSDQTELCRCHSLHLKMGVEQCMEKINEYFSGKVQWNNGNIGKWPASLGIPKGRWAFFLSSLHFQMDGCCRNCTKTWMLRPAKSAQSHLSNDELGNAHKKSLIWRSIHLLNWAILLTSKNILNIRQSRLGIFMAGSMFHDWDFINE